MKTERNLQDDLKGNQEKAFYIEAPVNEEGRANCSLSHPTKTLSFTTVMYFSLE